MLNIPYDGPTHRSTTLTGRSHTPLLTVDKKCLEVKAGRKDSSIPFTIQVPCISLFTGEFAPLCKKTQILAKAGEACTREGKTTAKIRFAQGPPKNGLIHFPERVLSCFVICLHFCQHIRDNAAKVRKRQTKLLGCQSMCTPGPGAACPALVEEIACQGAQKRSQALAEEKQCLPQPSGQFFFARLRPL